MTTHAVNGPNSSSADADAFFPPGPGEWRRLADHFPGALTAEYRLLYAETAPAAMAGMFERYGVLAKGMDVAYVNGHMYIAPVPLAGPREMKRVPPAGLVWLLSRIHPAFRKRTAAARRTLAARPWREVTRQWFEAERAEWQQQNLALQSLDPATMSSTELRSHLVDCRRHVINGYSRHFSLHGDDFLPVGLLIVQCAEWGIEPAVAMRALDALAPVGALAAETPAWQLVTGYDLDAQAWAELKRHDATATTTARQPLDLASLVAPDHHVELHALVDDARAAARFRDDNGLMTGAWPMGLLRRVMLETGRQLGFADPNLAIEMTVDELITAMNDPKGLDCTAIAVRRDHRVRQSALDAPSSMGPSFPIPKLSALPRSLALIGAAQLAAADHMTGLGEGAVGVGEKSYTGRALVVDDALIAFDLFVPGDIVITRFTSPSWNALLMDAGGLVTTTGGLACHAATIARELGLPAVIGDATAVARFQTGDLVVVNPISATVVHAGQ